LDEAQQKARKLAELFEASSRRSPSELEEITRSSIAVLSQRAPKGLRRTCPRESGDVVNIVSR
jgi:hypothetical protein